MEKANEALNLGDKGSRLTADELEVAADELQKSLESTDVAALCNRILLYPLQAGRGSLPPGYTLSLSLMSLFNAL